MRRQPTGSPFSPVLVIPAALAVFTAVVIVLTIRSVGFAVVAGIAVFLVAFIATIVLERWMNRPGR